MKITSVMGLYQLVKTLCPDRLSVWCAGTPTQPGTNAQSDICTRMATVPVPPVNLRVEDEAIANITAVRTLLRLARS